eukprot:6214053-Pleurochrysis_carterae.AAC.1
MHHQVPTCEGVSVSASLQACARIAGVRRVRTGIIDVMREWLRMYKTVDGAHTTAAHPLIPAAHPLIPAAHPLIPAAHPLFPAAHPLIPAAHPLIPAAHPLIPAAFPFQQVAPPRRRGIPAVLHRQSLLRVHTKVP